MKLLREVVALALRRSKATTKEAKSPQNYVQKSLKQQNMSYTKEELQAIAEQIKQFHKGGEKEIAYKNPHTGEVTIYTVPLSGDDRTRLTNITNDIANAEIRNDPSRTAEGES